MLPISCPECGTSHPADAAYCFACGAEMVEGDSELEQIERRAAYRALTRGLIGFQGVRVLLAVVAVPYGVVALGCIAALFDDAMAEAFFGDDRTLLFALLFSTSFVTTVNVLGAVRIYREPRLWTIGPAVLSTINRVRGALMGDDLDWTQLGCFVTGALWIGVFLTLPVRRLMEDHPTLLPSRRLERRLG